MNLDKLSNDLFDLSRNCAKEDESIIMEASAVIKVLNDENAALRRQLISVCNELMEKR